MPGNQLLATSGSLSLPLAMPDNTTIAIMVHSSYIMILHFDRYSYVLPLTHSSTTPSLLFLFGHHPLWKVQKRAVAEEEKKKVTFLSC